MSVIVLLVVVYVGLYVVLSIPSVQNKVKDKVCRETSKVLGGDLKMESLTIHPFSEVILSGVGLYSPENEKCASIKKVAAGIDLWALFIDRKIVLNYAEIIGMNVGVSQQAKDAPLNIQFLIDALAPKDKNKPSAIFDLRIRNIVIRDSKASFSRPWMKDTEGNKLPFADVDVSRLRMDLSIPVLRNDLYKFDIRNLQFEVTPGVNLRGLTAEIRYSRDQDKSRGGDRLEVKDLNINLPNTSLAIGDIDLRLDSITGVRGTVEGILTPSDFSNILPTLSAFDTPWSMDIDATYVKNEIELAKINLTNEDSKSSLRLEGFIGNLNKKDSLNLELDKMHAEISSSLISKVVTNLTHLPAQKGLQIIESLGNVAIDIEGKLMDGNIADAQGRINTESGNIEFTASGSRLASGRPTLSIKANAENLELDKLLSSNKLGKATFSIEGETTGLDKNADGYVSLKSEECEVMGNLLTGVDLELRKNKDAVDLDLYLATDVMELNLDAGAEISGKNSNMQAEMLISGFNPSDFGLKGKMADSNISGRISANTKGNNLDNATGTIELSDLMLERNDGNKLQLKELTVSVDSLTSLSADDEAINKRLINLKSDWFDARVSGEIYPSTLLKELKGMIESVMPSIGVTDAHIPDEKAASNAFDFDINIKGVATPYAFFNTPVRPLTNIPLYGSFDLKQGKAFVKISTPHLQQGKNKLIRNVDVSFDIDSFLGMAKVNAGLIFPAKKGDVEIAADIYAMRDKINLNLGLNPSMESVLKGGISLEAALARYPHPLKPEGELAVRVDILPSAITISDKTWSIANGAIDYSGKRIDVSNFLISHDDQYVRIEGTASENDEDAVLVKLNDIDLEYIFNVLNINYVSFGGMATGEVIGRRLLTKDLEARTEFLHVKDLSYNGAILGDGDLASDYDIAQQKVGIYGVIRDALTRERRVSVDGGIWVTRDSLSFDIDAQKVNVGIMKPFVSAFCSDLYGKASGKCKLFGTFSDIDLIGGLRADTLSMKLDFTNTWYHAGNDSVYLYNGVIDIPPLTLYDDDKHTAEFSGWLRHTYFHNPVFNFRLKDAKSLLCYDTNEKINPLWYGTIYGSGHAQINGYPGQIDIDMNMTTDEGSKFYYVISDAEDVDQYSFLTFTDRRKEIKELEAVDSVPDYLLKFQKHTEELEEGSSNVILSLKGTVTNNALVTLVMDPKAGDKIIARGQGALQMDYNLASNDLRMIGTYVLDEGSYNFTLQDIIIKNFNIRKGSLIKFDGDPMNANLDIAATYRVNTNLTDLDKSFSTDKELNRTNVPVDALLLVKGPMTNPDITFDIELPSLTSDVERKVKSIVSTNDMMSRQIIYLLALNRFYTPEYTGGQSNGSEWSSMASSTISSQLSNILSQMTDKLDVAPSFRSDKGDFTDMEFDLALSSRLLNNRLLINGNFGYRDRNTSNTQFVGDFDIEYLLSKNGNLRLKAYNHFNDQNYYLRSALTTQGVGVVFQRDFDRLFRRKKEDIIKTEGEERRDSTAMPADMKPESKVNNNDSINHINN
ncbi:MAG: translocation/assembly module TamB [Muribaculaceae bacterium]|nr:translocation/assembly module TamB [Muribaculaceae bacterium]